MTDRERPIFGWKGIADAIDVSEDTALRLARLSFDPLPVYRIRGVRTVWAFPSALRDWHQRSTEHVARAERIAACGGRE